MYQYSDSESLDSEEGLRYKTESIRNKCEENVTSDTSRSRSRSRSPRNRHKNIIGPQLPSSLENSAEGATNASSPTAQSERTDKSKSSESTSYFGPALPPHILKNRSATESEIEERISIGPQLPPSFKKNPECEDSESEQSFSLNEDNYTDVACIGPALPQHLRKTTQHDNASPEQSDDEVYGPLPPEASLSSKAHIALEERALELKLNQLEPQKEPAVVREEWMLELPEVKAAKFGLGPRQFKSKVGPDLSDRSSWTDTPDKKQKPEEKIDLKKVAELKETKKKDAEQERIAKKLKKNKESLLEIHQEKLKEKKKDEGPTERRPFSREIDLQVNRFDEAQKKAVLKKAQLLDDRFSSGQSKFL